MSNKQNLINYLLQNGKSETMSWADLATGFSLKSAEVARHTWRDYKKQVSKYPTLKTSVQTSWGFLSKNDPNYKLTKDNPWPGTIAETGNYIADLENEIVEHIQDKEKGTAKVSFTHTLEVLSDEEIYKECKIDKSNWKLVQIWQKKRSNGFVYSANFKLIEQNSVEEKLNRFESFLENYTSKYTPLRKADILVNDVYARPCSALISLTDVHLGKLALNNKNIHKHVEDYKKVLEGLLYKAYKSHYIDEIVFVIGGDYYHSDTIDIKTTAGTPLTSSSTWDQEYEIGYDLMVESINKLKQFCNTLHVILIQGNHARTKEYYLAHALETYFSSESNIKFDRSPKSRKSHVYGSTVLFFHHGNCKDVKLPLVFATEFGEEWGKSKYKEIILGDKHYNKEISFKWNQNEANGVRMRQLPAISETDLWHDDNLFCGALQAGICVIYDYKAGKVTEFEERI